MAVCQHRFLSVYCAAALISVLGNRKESKSSFIIANSEHVRSGYSLCVHRFARKTFNFFSPPPPLQALICSPTAQTSVRLWAILIAAGCRASCPLTGARVPTTGATSMCPAWTRSPTQRYLKAQSKRPIDHSPPLAKRRLSVPNTSTSTSATTTAP